MNGKLVLSLVAFLALTLGAQRDGYAAGTAHDLVKIYLATGNQPMRLTPLEHVVVNITRVDCPHTVTSCTLALSVMDEICGEDGGTSWKILVAVDGYEIDRGPYQPETRGCAAGNWLGEVPVAPGPHEVTLATYVEGISVEQGRWSLNYMVTTP
jgi:hypothetical protein